MAELIIAWGLLLAEKGRFEVDEGLGLVDDAVFLVFVELVAVVQFLALELSEFVFYS